MAIEMNPHPDPNPNPSPNPNQVSCSTTLYRARHPRPVLPADHATLDGFVAAVDAAWKVTWAHA